MSHQVLRFRLSDPLTPSDARQYFALFILSVFGDYDTERLAYCLVGSLAEYALRCPVPTGDNAVETLLTIASSLD